MKIRKRDGKIIEVHIINKKFVTLKDFKNNSSPCSNCALFDGYQLECTFPKDKVKECKFEQETDKGWNTLEYVEDFHDPKDEIITP